MGAKSPLGHLNMSKPVSVLIMAPPQASASVLFGLFDILSAAGQDWETLVSGEAVTPIFEVKLVGPSRQPFSCGSGMLIAADYTYEDAPDCDLIVVPGINISPIERLDIEDHPGIGWLKARCRSGTRIVSACTGAVYLAETGLLDGVEITTHWAFERLFHRFYPDVRLRLDRGLCFAEATRGPVTSGGTTGWQELALFLITNYGGLRCASKTAKVWLMADRGELQAPFTSMLKSTPHDDKIIEDVQLWIADNYADENPVAGMAEKAGMPATTFSRRFRNATGRKPLDYVQSLRIEEARQLLETTEIPVAEIGDEVGYADPVSFRRLFKRRTGLTPAEHRRMFGAPRFARYR